MRLEVHHYFHTDDAAVLAEIAKLRRDIRDMNLKLSAAVAALTQSTAEIAGKLDSIENYVRGVPDVVAAAVADALAQADVDANAAADLIDAARTTTEKEVGDVLAAIDNPGGGGEDTTDDGAGDDTVTGGEA